MSETRIQKILAQAGIASRRKAEDLIKSGAVTVNGKVAKLGDKATFGKDHIKLDGKLIFKVEPSVYVLFYKPKGVISLMSDPEGRPTLKTYLSKISVRLFPVSTLDFNSDGLLLLTNDGDLAEAIQKNPKFPRVYHAKLKGYLTSEMLKRIERGGKVGTGYVKPFSVRIQEELNKKTRIEIVLLGEANADLKLFLESRGFLVEKITRVGMGHLNLKGLEPGDFKILPKSKLEALVLQPELGVKEIEKRVEKERDILPVDLQDDGKFKLAVTLAPKGANKTSGIKALREAVAGTAAGTEEREYQASMKESPSRRSNRDDDGSNEDSPRSVGRDFSRDENRTPVRSARNEGPRRRKMRRENAENGGENANVDKPFKTVKSANPSRSGPPRSPGDFVGAAGRAKRGERNDRFAERDSDRPVRRERDSSEGFSRGGPRRNDRSKKSGARNDRPERTNPSDDQSQYTAYKVTSRAEYRDEGTREARGISERRPETRNKFSDKPSGGARSAPFRSESTKRPGGFFGQKMDSDDSAPSRPGKFGKSPTTRATANRMRSGGGERGISRDGENGERNHARSERGSKSAAPRSGTRGGGKRPPARGSRR